MDEISIKTPNPKSRLYWCLTEFIDWRYGQSFWYFVQYSCSGTGGGKGGGGTDRYLYWSILRIAHT
jgi:hypothetical protein